jgi:hypothetical protein
MGLLGQCQWVTPRVFGGVEVNLYTVHNGAAVLAAKLTRPMASQGKRAQMSALAFLSHDLPQRANRFAGILPQVSCNVNGAAPARTGPGDDQT